jgi:filamentous hemagglutinin family protein
MMAMNHLFSILRNDRKFGVFLYQSLALAIAALLAGTIGQSAQASSPDPVSAAGKDRASSAAIAPTPPTLLTQAIVPAADGTGTQVDLAGNRFDITGGTLSGDRANLFHSFLRLGLSADQIANFMVNPNLQNVLGRVVGGEASIINGLVQVTGGNANLFLINPAGIVFGPNARLDLAGAFTATTAHGVKFGDQWFNAAGPNQYGALVGNPQAFAFTTDQAGAIVNAGNLAVAPGQGLTLVGGTVVNTGTLTAPGGQITIAAVPGTNQVQINQPGVLLGLRVTPLGSNGPNPLPFTPGTLPALLTGGSPVAATGIVVNPDGTVQLAAGGTIPTSAGTAIASGTVTVAGQTGGTVGVLGDRVGVMNGTINASGTNGGGTVLIGGDYQGQGTVPNAQRTYISPNSTIKADALQAGNGGRVIAWANEATAFSGNISARGGNQSGDGGLVEVSGKQNLEFKGSVDVGSAHGSLGTLLLDPTNIIISNAASTGGVDASLPNILQSDFTGSDITINAATLQSQAGNVRLEATNNITIATGVSLNFVPGGSITFTAGTVTPTGSFAMDTSQTIFAQGNGTTNGRNITISGANITVGNIDTSIDALNSPTNAGSINLQSTGGSIRTGNLITAVNNGLGAAGNITLAVNSGTGSIDTSAGGLLATGINGSGGAISLTTQAGNITTGAIRSDSSTIVTGAQGGDITLRVNAGAGSIDTDGPNGGALDSRAYNFPGTSGNISLSTVNGNIRTGNLLSGSAALSGNSGRITLQTTGTGSISTTGGTLDSSSASFGNTKNGEITLTSSGGAIATGVMASTNADPALGGDIALTANQIDVTSPVSSTGNLLLQPFNPAQAIVLGGLSNPSPGTLVLTNSTLFFLQPGFSNITIGRSNGSGAFSNFNNVTFNDPVTLQSPNTPGSIAINAAITHNATLALNAPTIALNAPITGNGSLIQGVNAASSIRIGAGGNLQTGVDLAAPGSQVNVSSGTYNLINEVAINKNLTVQGAGAGSTIFDGGNTSRVFSISGSGTVVTLDGLTIQNGRVTGTGANGGGIQVGSGSTLNLTNSTLSGNSADSYGGGIFNGGTLTVSNSTLTQNQANTNDLGGGAIANSGILTVNQGTRIINNSGFNGGGILSLPLIGPTLQVTVESGTTIANNSATFGGGIYNSFGGTFNITGSTLSGNNASTGGAIFNQSATNLNLNNSSVINNSANATGGGIFNEVSGGLTLNNSTLSGNIAGSNGGGIQNNGTATIAGSTIDGNTATGLGGGIAQTAAGANLTITNSRLTNNRANSSSGIYSDTTLSLSLSNSTLDDVQTTSSGTTALSGNITTTGTQTYNNTVTLGSNTTLQGSALTFNNTVNAGSNTVTLTADEINLNGTVTGTGNLTLQPITPSQSIALGNPTDSGSGTLDLTTNDLNALRPGFNRVTIGRTDGRGTITVAPNVGFQAPTTLRTPGGDVVLQGNVNLQNSATLTFDSLSATTTLTQNITNANTPLNFYGRVLLGSDLTISSESNIRFTGALDGDRLLTLNGSAVQFDAPVGSAIPLKGLTINSPSTSVGGNITTTGDIQLNSTVIVSNNAAINARSGSITATGNIIGEGSPVTLAAPGGRVAVQNVSTLGQPINLIARDSITAGAINSANASGKGGDVLLDPQGDIQVTSIDAQGGANSVGGTVDITTASLFRATGTFVDRNGVLASISTAGGAGGGEITIRQGGGLTNNPFVIGNAASNGTAGAITSGQFTLAPVQSIRSSLTQGNVRIVSTAREDFTRNLVQPEQQDAQSPALTPEAQKGFREETPGVVSLVAVDKTDANESVTTLETVATDQYETYFGLREDATIQTVTDASTTLQQIETAVGVKPAIVYIAFAPSARSPTLNA